ncbi:hypothetical protein TH24_03370 [Thalassospira xiamenensis]|nr:hypothetical protein TH24_03370 [Thalassospira xiamenensis]
MPFADNAADNAADNMDIADGYRSTACQYRGNRQQLSHVPIPILAFFMRRTINLWLFVTKTGTEKLAFSIRLKVF